MVLPACWLCLTILAADAVWLFMEFLRVIDVFKTMGPAQRSPPGPKYDLSGFVFVLYLDGRQHGGRGGLIAVAITCFDAETLSLSASSNFYFVRA